MEHNHKSITFTRVKSGDRWRVQMSILGMIFTISNTPMKFKSRRVVENLDARNTRLKLELLFERGGHCELCGLSLKKDNCQIHHIKPLSVHPELRYDKENLMLLCKECHSGLHSAAVGKANMILAGEIRDNKKAEIRTMSLRRILQSPH